MRTAWIDIVFTTVLAVLGCWIIYNAFRFGLTGPTGIGGGLFPLVSGAVILGCSIATLLDKTDRDGLADKIIDWPMVRPVALMAAATATLIALIPVFGLIALTFPYVVAVSLIIERPSRASGYATVLVIAATTTVGLYYLFSEALNIPLPCGMFEE